jgi:hypothetical protein
MHLSFVIRARLSVSNATQTPDEPRWMLSAEVSDDGAYVIVEIYESTAPVNRLYYAALSPGAIEQGTRQLGSQSKEHTH